jgi:hypothetical protein
LCQKHPIYLEHAAKIADREPEKPITFRDSGLWRSGEVALETHGPRTIYFVPEGDDEIAYQARLERVWLHPTADDETTQKLLQDCLPETQDQGLWEEYEDQVRTLYVVSHCERVEPPFAYTALTKLSDGSPIDESYRSGYVLVYEYCEACQSSPCDC